MVSAMFRLSAEGEDVIMGGEGNGGVIWPAVTYVRDSLGAMALILALLQRHAVPLSSIVSQIPEYAICKRKVDLPDRSAADRAGEAVAAHYTSDRVDRQDGVRVDFEPGRIAPDGSAWVHVRASNTEPIMRLIAEAPEREQAESLLDEVARVIERANA